MSILEIYENIKKKYNGNVKYIVSVSIRFTPTKVRVIRSVISVEISRLG